MIFVIDAIVLLFLSIALLCIFAVADDDDVSCPLTTVAVAAAAAL